MLEFVPSRFLLPSQNTPSFHRFHLNNTLFLCSLCFASCFYITPLLPQFDEVKSSQTVKSTFIESVRVFVSSGLCGDDLKDLAVGSMVAGDFKAAVLAFKAPSREPVSELHCWLAGAQDSL